MGERDGDDETPPSFSSEHTTAHNKSTSGSPYCLASSHSRNEDIKIMTKGILGSFYFRPRDSGETEKDIRLKTKSIFESFYFTLGGFV